MASFSSPLDRMPGRAAPTGGLRLLRADLARTYAIASGRPLLRAIACLRAPGVHAAVVFRFGQSVRAMPWPLRLFLEPVYFVLDTLVRVCWGIELPRAARIGPGLYIGHFGGITVASGAVIGRRFTLSQGVTIGVSGQGDQRGTPVIGDNVYIAPGARLFGRIRIGDNVKIGANAVVHTDLPDNAVAVLDPGFRIVSYKGNQPVVAVPSEDDGV